MVEAPGTCRYDYRDIDNANMPLNYYVVAPVSRCLRDPSHGPQPRSVGASRQVRAAIMGVDPAIALLPPSTLLDAASVPFAVSGSALKILAILGFAVAPARVDGAFLGRLLRGVASYPGARDPARIGSDWNGNRFVGASGRVPPGHWRNGRRDGLRPSCWRWGSAAR